MDIDLLAKMVGELILEHDEVALPGVGTFVAELVGASFSDKGFTINPPYRKLSFRQREGDGSLLVDFYARTNSLEKSTAEDILTRYLAEMKEVLKTRKFIIFPGLGRLRATKENLFFFVPDENLNIYPEGFGLEPVSLKSHEELEEVTDLAETAAAVAAIQGVPSDDPSGANTLESAPPVEENAPSGANTLESAPPIEENAPLGAKSPESAPPVAETIASPVIPGSDRGSQMADQVGHDVVESPAAEPEPEPEPDAEAENDAEPEAEPEPAAPRRPIPIWLKPLLIILAVAAAALIALAILGRVAPEFVDRFLYTPEELEILYP